MEQIKTKRIWQKCSKWIEKGRKESNSSGILFILCLLFLYGCQRNGHRDFFDHMKEKYTDMKIRGNFCFLKSFGISKAATFIDGKAYWKLNCDSDSYFYLTGYLRKQADSIMLIPVDHNSAKYSFEEGKIFDFNVQPNTAWKFYFKTDYKTLKGDSVTFTGKKIVNSDTLYNYSIANITYNMRVKKIIEVGRQFDLVVSKKNGIISITRWGVPRRIEFQATLYPKEKFINNLGDMLEL